jgi:hypothetical protein
VIQKVRADAQAQASAANGFEGDPLRPLGRYYGHLASAAATTGQALHAPEPPPPPPVAAAPAPPPPAAAPARPAPRCKTKRIVRRHRHVVRRRTRSGRRYRSVRIHRHVRKRRVCR